MVKTDGNETDRKYETVTVYSTLCDGEGKVLARGQSTARNTQLATLSAEHWAWGELARADDRNAYVEHTFSTDRRTPNTPYVGATATPA